MDLKRFRRGILRFAEIASLNVSEKPQTFARSAKLCATKARYKKQRPRRAAWTRPYASAERCGTMGKAADLREKREGLRYKSGAGGKIGPYNYLQLGKRKEPTRVCHPNEVVLV